MKIFLEDSIIIFLRFHWTQLSFLFMVQLQGMLGKPEYGMCCFVGKEQLCPQERERSGFE
jgi:hypothetical protein